MLYDIKHAPFQQERKHIIFIPNGFPFFIIIIYKVMPIVLSFMLQYSMLEVWKRRRTILEVKDNAEDHNGLVGLTLATNLKGSGTLLVIVKD